MWTATRHTDAFAAQRTPYVDGGGSVLVAVPFPVAKRSFLQCPALAVGNFGMQVANEIQEQLAREAPTIDYITAMAAYQRSLAHSAVANDDNLHYVCTATMLRACIIHCALQGNATDATITPMCTY